MTPAVPVSPPGPQGRFLATLAVGRFELPACGRCGRHRFPPTAVCPACGATTIRWEASSGRGTVYSATTVRRQSDAGGDYGVCLVDLEEGVRLMSRVEGVAPDAVAIGMPVVARLRPDAEGVMTLVFEPATARPGPDPDPAPADARG